jgi:Ca2+-binding EF-hand superfamily protein
MKMAEAELQKDQVIHPAARNLDKIELFRTFKKYDRNMNGTLDFAEYTQCLTECPDIDLSKQEIITVAMAADLNGDGEVDFEEFMKHFPNVLNLIEYNKVL